MCGILGVAAIRGERPSAGAGDIDRMRQTLERRGPDGASVWREENVVFAHQRLKVRDLSAAGEQPMATPDGRYHIVYNGELYNDAELRRELVEAGVVSEFRGQCDTETVLWAFAHWGKDAFEHLRGMFAIAAYDTVEHVLYLARDPLGIKPLYYHVGRHELTFASAPRAILAHPHITARPNVPMLSAYLTTLRSVLGAHTLFDGIRSVRPGQRIRFDAKTGRVTMGKFYSPPRVDANERDTSSTTDAVRAAVEESVERHLRADVPVCSLLSGGLDSSIICRVAADRGLELHTWCAGGRDDGRESTDFTYARAMAAELGSTHREIVIEREQFRDDWSWMVNELGMPLSTPNEVAIHAVCRDLRDAGYVVALSGEGADELFGGYEYAMLAANQFIAAGDDTRSGGQYQLESGAWVPTSLKEHVLAERPLREAGGDALLIDHYNELFARCEREAGPEADPLEAHLRFLRANNLTGLLQRLDTSSMLASVEGRTPFSDVRVASLAESLPMSNKFGDEYAPSGGGGTAVATSVRGKLVLRRAWAGRLAAGIETRPKHSFPLPFAGWLRDRAELLESSSFSREFFGETLRREVMDVSEQYSQIAWPMINLAMWGERWFA